MLVPIIEVCAVISEEGGEGEGQEEEFAAFQNLRSQEANKASDFFSLAKSPRLTEALSATQQASNLRRMGKNCVVCGKSSQRVKLEFAIEFLSVFSLMALLTGTGICWQCE